jgi:hypothetical protein
MVVIEFNNKINVLQVPCGGFKPCSEQFTLSYAEGNWGELNFYMK